tara:strand:+ start:1009 stop:1881 length:873 start_codon:yes stop_codon:yes gene_type:complete
MSAATANLEVPVQNGEVTDHVLLADQVVYEGTPVFADATSGYAQTNDGVTITLVTGDLFLGICEAKADSTDLASGDISVKLRTKGVFEMTISGTVTLAKIGDPVYVNNTTDNATVTLTAAGDGSDCQIGYLVDYVSATKGKVMIDGAGRNQVGTNYDPTTGGVFGAGGMYVGKMTYSFAVDGGAVSTITPATTCIIPSGAIVYQAITNVTTAVTGASATVAVQLQAANDIHTAAAISGAPWSSTGLKAGTPVGTAATAILLTADRTAKVVVGTAATTAGVFTTYFLYMLA